MTIVTLRRGRQVIQILAHGGHAIVTTGTRSEYLEVIDRHGRVPHIGTVAVFTNVGGTDVIKRLAGSRNSVMTVTTSLGSDVLVVEIRG